jgi:hypothetical protein
MMQGNARKSLNNTGKSCIITIDDLEKYFVEPFTDPQSRQRRSELCAGFRMWLMEVRNCGLCLDVWVDGQFATYEAMPEYVGVACVIRSYQKEINEDRLSKFRSLVQKNSEWWLRKQYCCSVELNLISYGIIEKYGDWWFGGFDCYNNDGKRSGIFTISL